MNNNISPTFKSIINNSKLEEKALQAELKETNDVDVFFKLMALPLVTASKLGNAITPISNNKPKPKQPTFFAEKKQNNENDRPNNQSAAPETQVSFDL
jgi:hypothetical protein